MTEPIDLDAVKARAEAAHAEVVRLCEGGRWTMRVPAQEHRDSDLVLAASVSDVDKLANEVERLRGDVEELVFEAGERDQWANSLARRLDVPEDLDPYFGIERVAIEDNRVLGEAAEEVRRMKLERDDARAEIERLRAELSRWESGQRRKGLPRVESEVELAAAIDAADADGGTE